MRCLRGLSCCALSLVLVLGLPGVAAARAPAGSSGSGATNSAPEPGSPAAEKLARKHFKRALERYRKGAYREAIRELNKAIALDPHSKDLVYNRGLVYEKLGQIDNAIHEFEHYLTLEQDPEERERARAIIRRLKGARREVEKPAPPAGGGSPASSPAGSSPSPGSPTTPAPVARHGRLDTWVYVAGGVAVVAAVVGSIFGIRALATEPGVDQSTGGSRTYTGMQNDQSRAHSYAVAADVSFGVGILAGAAAGALYFLRAPAPAPADTARAMRALPPPAAPAPGFSWAVRF